MSRQFLLSVWCLSILFSIAGYLVGHLKAEDDDDDEVTFSIQGVVGDTLLYLDQNDPMEAEIRLKGELDFEVGIPEKKTR